MNVFLFPNSNHVIAYITAKIFAKYTENNENFAIVFDQEYSIFLNNPLLGNKFWTVHDKRVYEDVIIPNNVIVIDYKTQYECLQHKPSLDEWLSTCILGCKKFIQPVKYVPLIETKLQIEKFIEDQNKNNFSNILVVPYYLSDNWQDEFEINGNLWYDKKLRSFSPVLATHVQNFLIDKVNYINLLPNNEYKSNDLGYLVSCCDAVICNYDIVFQHANDLHVPCLVNLGVEQVVENISETTSIFDPYRNIKEIMPPSMFTESYKRALFTNNNIITYQEKEKILEKEILKLFKKHGVPYDSSV